MLPGNIFIITEWTQARGSFLTLKTLSYFELYVLAKLLSIVHVCPYVFYPII
ncbi:hypothetical protein C427_0012 [Paraglaciecola psychrophila 170]|uniref:Uncharacterized protein n=1 Tax=Paraglaciecola psychrophila 170 TaxID=1129794 RepID=K7A4U2_9ALTE|nr:hypothetical protein C427_0012 [Paraglaciecola psychrophila 170]GAC35873.1 hypothetical protein GPSY_0231 [Paraglaciecola psychrophila 170]